MVFFKGATSASLDEKGRFALPKRYRDRLPAEPALTLTAGFEPCLLLYETSAWEEATARLMQMPSISEGARHWQRMVVGHAEDVTLDKSDRVQIPSSLRDICALTKSLWLIGYGHYIEIWDLAEYQKHVATQRANPPKDVPVGAETFRL